MEENSLEVTKHIQIARKNFKEGNVYQANEIYKKLINNTFFFTFNKLKKKTYQ